MKKKSLVLLATMSAIVFMTGCGETKNEIYPEVTPKINLSEEYLSSGISIKSDQQSVTVSFASNVPWHAEVSADWVSLSSYSGKAGEESILINVMENTTFKQRTAVITISDVEEKSKVSVKITQDAMTASLMVEPESLSYSFQGGEESFIVTSNAKWMINKDADWIILDFEEGQGDAKVKATVLENRDLTSRNGAIIVSTSDGEIKQSVSVQQSGADVIFFVDERVINLTAAGGTFSVKVTHNIGYSVDSQQDWVRQVSKVANDDVDTYVFESEANDGTEARSGSIVFRNDHNESITVTVRQAGADASISAAPGELTFKANAESKSITIKSNTAWTAAPSASWLKLSSTNGDGDSQLTVTTETNAVATSRTATITIVATDGKATAIVKVVQSAADIIFTVDKDEFNVAATGTIFTVKVKHNIDYRIASRPDWVWQTNKTTEDDVDIYTFKTEINISTQAREGSIVFHNDNNTSISVMVRQMGAEAILSASPTGLTFTADSETKSISVSSNTMWTAISSDSWVRLGSTGGSGDSNLMVTAETNAVTTPRSATITLNTTDGKATATVKVIQGAADVIFTVDKKEFNVMANGETFTVRVTRNIGYQIESQPDWIRTTNKVSGGDVDTYTFKADVNVVTKTREGGIVFRNDNSDRITVTVKQSGADASISANPTELTFKANAESKSIAIKSNTAWTATPSDSWLKLSSTEGRGDSQFTVTAEINAVANPRSATITLKTTDGKATATVKIIQGAADVIFTVDKKEFNVMANGETFTVRVTRNIGYQIESQPDWIRTTNKVSGGDVDTYTFKADVNVVTKTREGGIVFRNDNSDRITVTVKQSGADASISANPTELTFKANAESKSIAIKSNTAWTATPSDSWLKLSSTEGRGDSQFTVTAETNAVASPRSATITFKTTDGKAIATVKVSQNAADVIFTVDKKEFNVVAAGEKFSVKVTHNIGYSIASQSDWLKRINKVTEGNVDTYTFEAEANPLAVPRSATITFKSYEGNLIVAIKVSQEPADPLFSIDNHKFSVESDGVKLQVRVSHNITYRISSMPTWVSITNKASSGNTDTYTFSVHPNPDYKREGRIVFRYNDIDNIVTIMQFGSKKNSGNDDTTTGGNITLE